MRPLSVDILLNNQPLSADRTYDIECQAIGSKPSAKITWWMNGVQLRNFKEKVHTYVNQINLEFVSCQMIYGFFMMFYDVMQTVNHWNRSRIDGIWNIFLVQFLFCVSFALTTVSLEQAIKLSNFIPSSCFRSLIKKTLISKRVYVFQTNFSRIISNIVKERNELAPKSKKLTWRREKWRKSNWFDVMIVKKRNKKKQSNISVLIYPNLWLLLWLIRYWIQAIVSACTFSTFNEKEFLVQILSN